MTAENSQTDLVSFIAYPNPPLPRQASLIVLAAVGAAVLLVSLLVATAGAWPVVPFLGIDVIALALAFYVITQRSKRQEIIEVDGRTLSVQHSHTPVRWTARASDLRVSLVGGPGASSRRLMLLDRHRSIEIGNCLTLEEKTELAQALRSALSAQLRG